MDSDIVCADEFKNSVLIKSCFLPGFCTFLCNLFKTIGGNFCAHIETLQEKPVKKWEKMYMTGLEKEIYEVPLSRAYYGASVCCKLRFSPGGLGV